MKGLLRIQAYRGDTEFGSRLYCHQWLLEDSENTFYVLVKHFQKGILIDSLSKASGYHWKELEVKP